MKNILFFMALMFFGVGALAQNSKWIFIKAKKNCQIGEMTKYDEEFWKKNFKMTWSGDCNNGFAEGQGIKTISAKKHKGILFKYEGTMLNGKHHGKGVETYNYSPLYPDRLPYQYSGEWKQGEYHGKGTLLMFIYDENTKRFTKSTKIYEGEFKDGSINGQGTFWDYTFCCNNTGSHLNGYYTGEWLEGKEHGKGKETRLRYGDTTMVYTGDWKNGRWEGIATYIKKEVNSKNQKTITTYQGSWKDGSMDGIGTYTYESEGKINNTTNGLLTVIRYEGAWKNGKKNGQGSVKYADGTTWTGMWKDDEPIFSENQKKGYTLLETLSGCKVWVEVEGSTSVSWSGDCVNGLAEGYGVRKVSEKGKLVSEYTGYMVKGKREGEGHCVWYTGASDGQKLILWTMGVKKNNAEYQGSWKEDKFDGKGVFDSGNGQKYVSYYWEDGKELAEADGLEKEKTKVIKNQNGCGWLCPAEKSKIMSFEWSGDCVNGLVHGKGTLKVYENKVLSFTYQGDMLGGQAHGQGTASGEGGTLEGKWKSNDYLPEFGTTTEANGTKHIGIFINNDPCPTCKGRGKVVCDVCGGAGQVKQSRENVYYNQPIREEYMATCSPYVGCRSCNGTRIKKK